MAIAFQWHVNNGISDTGCDNVAIDWNSASSVAIDWNSVSRVEIAIGMVCQLHVIAIDLGNLRHGTILQLNLSSIESLPQESKHHKHSCCAWHNGHDVTANVRKSGIGVENLKRLDAPCHHSLASSHFVYWVRLCLNIHVTVLAFLWRSMERGSCWY